VFCGVESLSKSQLRRYGKSASVEEIINGVEIIRNQGIAMELGYILFDPLLTIEELQENINVLENTFIWKDIAFLLSFLRLHKGTPLEGMMIKKGLLGRFNPDLITYEWKFADKKIEAIATKCKIWKEEFHPVYRALLNVGRSDLNSEIARIFLIQCRQQDLEFLKSTLYSILQSDPPFEFLMSPKEKRIGMVKELYTILKGKGKTHAENLLFTEIEKYLSFWRDIREAEFLL
jgi:hypothetical protein